MEGKGVILHHPVRVEHHVELLGPGAAAGEHHVIWDPRRGQELHGVPEIHPEIPGVAEPVACHRPTKRVRDVVGRTEFRHNLE